MRTSAFIKFVKLWLVMVTTIVYSDNSIKQWCCQLYICCSYFICLLREIN